MSNLKKVPIILMLVLSVLSFSLNAYAFDGTVEGGTITPTDNGVRLDGQGNMTFKGDWSTASRVMSPPELEPRVRFPVLLIAAST